MKHLFKKTGLSLFLSLVLMMSLAQTMVFAATSTTSFSDVPANHWAKETIEWGVEQGIIQGDGNNRFRPNDAINQAEFMALLIRAFPNDYEVYKSTGTWYEPYYSLAKQLNWQYKHSDPTKWSFERGLAATLIYNALEQKDATSNVAINHLLSQGLATGKTSNTYDGFQPFDTLTRAEAVTFVYRVYNYVNDKRDGSITDGRPVKVERPADTSLASVTLGGIELESTVKNLESKLGKPSRILKTYYVYDWYVYNIDGKHLRYAVADNKVVGFYSNSLDVFSGGKYQIGVNTRNGIVKDTQYYSSYKPFTYSENKYSASLYFDTHTPKQLVDSILVIANDYDRYTVVSEYSSAVSKDMELGIFDITNSYRYKHGLTTLLEWSDQANKSAYLHSKDMSDKRYFEHASLDGRSPFERMEAQGIEYFSAGENIAMGYLDDIQVMSGWINSYGHRSNILEERYTHLGVGVYARYYTQNFYR